MNQFNALKATSWLVLLFGLVFAIFVGRLTGQTNTRDLTIIFGSLAVIVCCLWLRTAIWLLIPLCWSLTGRVSVLPLPFSVRDLGVLLAAVMFGIFFALKMIRFRSRNGWLEILIFLNIGYIGMMFMRHPVGTEAMQSEMVGGRPYFDSCIGLLAFLLLRMVVISPKKAKFFPFFMIAGSGIVAGLGVLTRMFPSTVPLIAPLYNGITTANYMVEEGYGGVIADDQRFTELAGPGTNIVTFLCSYFRPLTLLLPAHPFRMLLFAVGLGCILYSGFRNYLVAAAIFFVIASYFRGGGRDVVRAIAAGMVGLTLLLVVQLSIGLPRQAQRALSFIPFVPWNQEAKSDAEGSTQWRLEMWKMVWNDKRYLHDKIWGDGFGFSGYELMIMRNGDMGGQGIVGAAAQENFMINGELHSGPLSTIRFAGVVGLILFMALLCYLAAKAPDVIKEARDTPYFSTALFICIPLVTSPLIFFFVFGGYDAAVADTFFSAGLLRLVQNSVSEYKRALPPVDNVPVPMIKAERAPALAGRMKRLPA